MKFGSLSPRLAAHLLFWLGFALILVAAAAAGWELCAVTEWQNVARDGWAVPITTRSLPVAIGCGAGFALVGGALWRVFCEFCYCKLRFLHASFEKKTEA